RGPFAFWFERFPVVKLRPAIVVLAAVAGALGGLRAQPAAGDFERRFESKYNTITIVRKGEIVEMRARLNARAREYLESAVNLEQPLRLVVPYTRTLFAGLFID